MLVHKIYLIVWLELDSNLFGFNRLSLSLEKKKEKELSLSLSLGPVPLPAAHSPLFLPLARPALLSPARGPPGPIHLLPRAQPARPSSIGPAPPAPRFPPSSSD
jgi:hypothetical protein